MKQATKKHRDESTNGKTPQADRIIEALESIIRKHKAGENVLGRLVNDERAEEPLATTLGAALTLALFGQRAMPAEPREGEFVVCNAEEYAAFQAAGNGSAERGVKLMISSAIAWMRRDRAELVEWASKTLPTIELIIGAPNEIRENGLFAAEYFQIPVRSGAWFAPLQRVAVEACKGDMLADAIIRALALRANRQHLDRAA